MNEPLYELVGFNYSAAVLELLRTMTYENLAEQLGYKSKGSITGLIEGQLPGHIQGEALWALYMKTFGKKPPLDVHLNGHAFTT